MVRFEVSSSAAMASAVSGFRVRRSTWMIWNSRSARLMVVLLRRMVSMLTARWQQEVGSLEHDPEKWIPVFGKDHAQSESWSRMTFRREVILLQEFPTDEESPHDDPPWLRRRLRPAGNQSVRDQDRGPAQDGRSCLSQGTGDAAVLTQGTTALY